MQDITTVEFRKIYENKSTGLCTWELQNMDEHFRLLSDIVREEGWGDSILDTARNGRINAKRRFTFRSGGAMMLLIWTFWMVSVMGGVQPYLKTSMGCMCRGSAESRITPPIGSCLE